MQLSKTRLSEIESLPDNAIDTSDIPELGDDFWENAQQVIPENYLQFKLNMKSWNGSKARDRITTSG